MLSTITTSITIIAYAGLILFNLSLPIACRNLCSADNAMLHFSYYLHINFILVSLARYAVLIFDRTHKNHRICRHIPTPSMPGISVELPFGATIALHAMPDIAGNPNTVSVTCRLSGIDICRAGHIITHKNKSEFIICQLRQNILIKIIVQKILMIFYGFNVTYTLIIQRREIWKR